MAKTENIFVRVEPEIKEQAECILNSLGVPMSNAVGMFLKQVVLQNGLPFEVKLPTNKPISYNSLSKGEFDSIIAQGVTDYDNGCVSNSAEVKAQMKKDFGL